MTGHVLFIGAGPGAADLITRRGWALLGTATVVLADALADPALREAAPAARWIDVGKRGFAHTTAQAEINRLLVEHALAGERVARLKGGDPSVFGRLEEEIEALQAAGIAAFAADAGADVVEGFEQGERQADGDQGHRAADAVLEFVNNGLNAAMNKFNGGIKD